MAKGAGRRVQGTRQNDFGLRIAEFLADGS